MFFFFNDTATTEIYTLSLHDALPISRRKVDPLGQPPTCQVNPTRGETCTSLGMRSVRTEDRKSTRLNSSHLVISYAVFCLKKKKQEFTNTTRSYLSNRDYAHSCNRRV